MERIHKKIAWHLLAAILILSACKSGQDQESTIPQRVSAANHNSSGPSLTQDHRGRAVLSWVEAQDSTGNYLLHYAIADEEGKTFGAPKAIPATKGIYPHDENLSKLVFKGNGDIMALFAVSKPNSENSYAGQVFYTQSFDGGQNWTAPHQLAQNASNSSDERYFDMVLLPNREIAAVWLDSRKDTDLEGSSLYFARTRGRSGFSGEKVIDQQLCQCCRTDLYVDQQGSLHVAYRAIIGGSIRDMVYLVSPDNGASFSKPMRISADNWVIAGCPHTGPAMTSNQQGMHFSWFTMGGGSGVYYNRKPAGRPFSPRQTVSQRNAARHPQMVTWGEGKIAITWDEQAPPAGNTHQRIGLQLRDEAGQLIQTLYLTSDSVTTTYPVILPVKKQQVLVAYTQKSGQKSEVWYQVVKL